MNSKTVSFLILLLFQTFYVFSVEKNARINYEIIKSSEQHILKLTVILIDTTGMNTTSGLPPRTHNAPTSPIFNDFEKHIVNSISENSLLEIFVKRPDYINEMLNLIQNQPDKERAIKIFNENNYINAIQTTVNQSISIVNGKIEKKISAEFIIPLAIMSSTEIIFESTSIDYNNNNYITEKLKIKIDK